MRTIKEWFRRTAYWRRADMMGEPLRSMCSETFRGEFRISGLRIDPWDGMRVEGRILYLKWRNGGSEVQLEAIRVRDPEEG